MIENEAKLWRMLTHRSFLQSPSSESFKSYAKRSQVFYFNGYTFHVQCDKLFS